MELRHLRYYLALAEELHFGRAAKRLHISQPPLSVTVRQLEDELGLQLLERNSHVVRLTPAGENFAASARQLLADAELAARRARDLASGVTSRVRIGFVGSMMFRGLPEGLRRFRQSHPAVQTELTELNSTDQLDALLRGQIDLGFVHTQRVPKGLSTCLYMSERFMLCVPQDGQRWRWPPPPAVANQALVLFSRGASPDYHERVLQLWDCPRPTSAPRCTWCGTNAAWGPRWARSSGRCVRSLTYQPEAQQRVTAFGCVDVAEPAARVQGPGVPGAPAPHAQLALGRALRVYLG